MRLPKLRIQRNRFAVSGCGGVNVAFVAERDSQVVVHIGAIGLAGKGLVESVDCRGILGVGVQAESEKAIGLGVPGIDAEGGAGFRNGAVGIVSAVEQVGQPAVNIGEARHHLF